MDMVDWEKLERFISKKMMEEHIAGVSVGISENGETIFQKSFGFRNKDLKLPVTPETIFGVASVTKSFTALAIMELEKKGLLSVKDPVIKYLPDFKINGIGDMETIKIHHLLSHSTGVPPMERKEHFNQFHNHFTYLREAEIKLLGDPGDYFSYCNDTFLLLGAIIEEVTGQLFRHYITKQFLQPLGMNRSTFSLDELNTFENVSIPYNYDRNLNTLVEVNWPTLGNYEVGGGIRSNVVDLLKYGQVYVNEENSHCQKMWEPVIRVGRDSYYGYALNITPNYAGEYTVVQHGGGQPGVSSNFGFIPERKLVVTVLTNVGGVSVGEIWLAAVNTALGLSIEYKLTEEPNFEMSLNDLRKFEGIYSSNEGDNVSVYLNNEKIIAEIEDQTFELRASGPETLVFIQSEKPIRFFFDQNKKPWALFNGSRMLRRKQNI
ncbi:serine hydrolase domain-containing protein [Pseudoneobacillus rhizosphaerae]|uniref:D-aminopeptidase n=1 Tax=Pseudoneobacillus rhizosphaerae TaxID=2880968 RepID=A0A9C7L8Z6_9BACI|nr:serine hydrolase domain-containing protein [Pseudoneobacillus rhizosphaerae]CAG9606387.1 D-aminopeptidase [Pseudoneobacillus rhizosphaerae]